MVTHESLPLSHNFEGIWEVAVGILHLKRVSIANLVVCPTVVGALNHDDITARTAQVDGITFTGQFSPN